MAEPLLQQLSLDDMGADVNLETAGVAAGEENGMAQEECEQEEINLARGSPPGFLCDEVLLAF